MVTASYVINADDNSHIYVRRLITLAITLSFSLQFHKVCKIPVKSA